MIDDAPRDHVARIRDQMAAAVDYAKRETRKKAEKLLDLASSMDAHAAARAYRLSPGKLNAGDVVRMVEARR